MKSLIQFSTRISATEKLGKDQKVALKGGDDKRPQRPGGGGPADPPPNPQPNGNAIGIYGWD